jgi:2-amino-4-hydroxy-6-hydroxymethyldihydropteridine diphosphokinase
MENLEETRDFIYFNFGDIVSTSGIYETEPWQMEGAEPFLNQIVVVNSALSNAEIIREIREIEVFYARQRSPEKYLPRAMDVDVLFIDQEVISQADLTVPHPKLAERRFILEPISEITPEWNHPVYNKTISELLAICPDNLKVRKL